LTVTNPIFNGDNVFGLVDIMFCYNPS